MKEEIKTSSVRNFWRKFRSIEFPSSSVPIALILLCLVAFAGLLPSLGFYWDDWPWIYLARVFGNRGMLLIDQAHRPLSGEILWIGSVLAGDSPLGWQVLNLFYRLLGGVALWWMLLKLWPGHVVRSTIIVMVFLVYPGFTQQYVSVNNSRHLLPMALYFLSVGFMLWGIREVPRYYLYTSISLVLALIAMLSTEYYYGLELLRPLFIWLVQSNEGKGLNRVKRTFLYWLPFLILLIAVFIWRFFVSRRVNYRITLIDSLRSSPIDTISDIFTSTIANITNTAIIVWSKLWDFPARSDFGLKNQLIFWALVAGSFIALLFYLSRLKNSQPINRIWVQVISVGLVSLVLAGLPFLVTDLNVNLRFPADRTTLPMIFGASLLFVGFFDAIIHKRLLLVVISLALALAIGVQYHSALDYQRDWNNQRSFFSQLSWRIPGLQAGTALYYTYTIALQDFRSTDNSLTAPLNLIYTENLDDNQLATMIFDLRLRLGSDIPTLANPAPINVKYGMFEFEGNTGDVIVIHYAPPACLQVLHPKYDQFAPHVPQVLKDALPLVNMDVIQPDQESTQSPPGYLIKSGGGSDWCYYYQKADLARQFEDWEEVVEIGEIAFNINDYPKHASERVPFIQGYAHTGKWQRASDLTYEVYGIDHSMAPWLCFIWDDLEDTTPDSQGKSEAVRNIWKHLKCQ